MKLKSLILPVMAMIAFCVPASGQTTCLYWQSEVDEGVNLPDSFQDIDQEKPENIMKGIECLLTLEGNKKKARFGGATHDYVSQIFPPAPVEVAALYYISYLFYQNWDHADGIALVGRKNSRFNSPENVRKAYRYYRAWFRQVQHIGLANARARKLEPLKNKDVRWY
jgi:hypothetical protein